MFTIDEIRIEGEEDGFHLVIYAEQDGYYAETKRYRIGLPDQFDAEVRRTIGAWLAEGETARAQTMSVARDDGYAVTDPKHSHYHDTLSSLYDNREGK